MKSKLFWVLIVLITAVIALNGCDESKKQSSCEHFTEMVGFKAVSCFEDGFTGKQICIKCGLVLYEGEIVPKYEHLLATYGQKEASCSEKGYSGDIICSFCKTVVEKGKITETTPHITEIVGEKDSSFSEEGYSGDSICQNCGVVVAKGEIIPVRKPQEGDQLDNGIYIPELKDIDHKTFNMLMEKYKDNIFITPDGTENLVFTDGIVISCLYRYSNFDRIIENFGNVIKITDYQKTNGDITSITISTEIYDDAGSLISTQQTGHDKNGEFLYDIYRTYKTKNDINIVTYKKELRAQQHYGKPALIESELTLKDNSTYEYVRKINDETIEYGSYKFVDYKCYLLHRKDSFDEYTITYNDDMVVTKIVHSIESIGEYGEYFYSESDPGNRYYIKVNWLKNGKLITYTQENTPFGVTSVDRNTASNIPSDSYP